MNIILTSDVELWSWNRNFEQDVKMGMLKLIELSEKEKVPLTLFISLSDKGYGNNNYLNEIKRLTNGIKSKNVAWGIHTHCKNLPIEYSNNSDNLKDYSEEEAIKILIWYKKELDNLSNKKITVHRAGGYHIPKLEILERCFKKTGIKIDSSLLFREYSQPLRLNGLSEIPPATNKKYAKKRIVFGPEQMSPGEMIKFYNNAKKKTDLLVINFHSFSVYGSLGLKAKIWHKIPTLLRLSLKPFIGKVKENFKQKEIKGLSENFKKLVWLIKFLKGRGDSFIDYDGVVINKAF